MPIKRHRRDGPDADDHPHRAAKRSPPPARGARIEDIILTAYAILLTAGAAGALLYPLGGVALWGALRANS